MKARLLGMALFPMMAWVNPPSHAVILSPTGATASSQHASYPIGNTINQSGLSLGFASGVDDFDAYISGNPLHSPMAFSNEWFTAAGVTSATVVYDLGALYLVDKFALWNEEASGIGTFDLLASANGVDYFSVLTGVSPIDNPTSNPPPSPNYSAQVFGLGANVDARYFQFNLSGCPQLPSTYNGCGIGEIAFNVNQVNQGVSVPGPLPVLGLAAAFGFSRKLRKRIKLSTNSAADTLGA